MRCTSSRHMPALAKLTIDKTFRLITSYCAAEEVQFCAGGRMLLLFCEGAARAATLRQRPRRRIPRRVCLGLDVRKCGLGGAFQLSHGTCALRLAGRRRRGRFP
jgi:hypothetical protein